MMELIDKDFKTTVINILKELKEDVKRVKKVMYRKRQKFQLKRKLKKKPKASSSAEMYNN